MSATKEHYHDEIEAGMRTKSPGLKATPFTKGDEHPILFSTEMVKAILEVRKEMTRRTKKLEEINKKPDSYSYKGTLSANPLIHVFARIWKETWVETIHLKCPYGKPGDLLWVRETWTKDKKFPLAVEEPNTSIFTYFFKADKKQHVAKLIKWKPSIHMPKEAARIWLQVEEVRVERLQNISEEDAMEEGAGKAIFWMHTSQIEIVDPAHVAYPTASYKLGFQKLWISINGIESWHENPWVWVVKYKVLSTSGRPITL